MKFLALVRGWSPEFARVDMPSSTCCKVHFNAHHYQHRCHGNQPRHGRVALIPKSRKTWVCERDERGGEEMNKGRCDKDTGTEVTGEEEEAVRYWDR